MRSLLAIVVTCTFAMAASAQEGIVIDYDIKVAIHNQKMHLQKRCWEVGM